MSQPSQRIAVLIDSDNVSAKHLEPVLAELARYGTTSVRRMYGDWTSDQLRGWKDAVNEHSVQPVQQFAYTSGKNATDSALIIDAMDLLHQNQMHAFAIVSSDSDFTRLAARLRESGAHVYGFGERKTPTSFVNACDTFTYFDALEVVGAETKDAEAQLGDADDAEGERPQQRARPTTKQLRQDSRLLNLLRAGISAGADEDGWANLGEVGSTVRKQSPDFDARNWGYAKLSDLIEAVGLFDINRVKGSGGGTNLQVRVPPKGK